MKSYKAEFRLKSLDEAIKNAVQWAKAFYFVDVLKRKELVDRVSNLEIQVAKLSKALKTS